MKLGQTKILGLALLLGGLALCSVGMWLLLSPAQYAATAKIRVVNDVDDKPPNGLSGYPYDLDFIQSTFEVIRTELVLSNAIAKLNLNEKWGKKHFHDSPLKNSESINFINQHLRLAPVPYTRQIEITYLCNDPEEAADIANAIAKSYWQYRSDVHEINSKKGIEVLQQIYQNEEKQLQLQPTNNQLLELHKLLGSKIEVEKLEMQVPGTLMVQFDDQAKPPQVSLSSNHPLGAALFAVGLFPLIGGILLLKPSRQTVI